MGERVVTGRHVFYGLLCFFAVVLAANAAFIYLALDTFPGLSTDNPYQRGLAYNETLDARAKQRALGWRAEVTFEERGEGRGTLTVVLRDRAGAPLEDLRVVGQVRRPTREGLDRDVALARSGPGAYSAELALPERGQWDVRLVADSRGGGRIEMARRLWLK